MNLEGSPTSRVKHLLFSLLGLSACASQPPRHGMEFEDMPGSVLSPVDLTGGSGWTDTVAKAAGEWNSGLAALGCPEPYRIGTGGHRVVLVTDSQWTLPNVVGMTWEDGTISVRDITVGVQSPATSVLHELGHGIGLGHASPAFGPSVMLVNNDGHIYQRDIAAAACILGCGPCDPKADPYDL